MGIRGIHRRSAAGRLGERGVSLIEVMVAAGIAAGFAMAIAQMMNNSSRGMRGVQMSAEFGDLSTMLSMILNNQDSCRAFMSGVTFNPAATAPTAASEMCGVYGGMKWQPHPPNGAAPTCGAGAGSDPGMDLVHMQLVSLSPTPAGGILTPGGMLNTYIGYIHLEVNRNRRQLASLATTARIDAPAPPSNNNAMGSPTIVRDIPVTVALAATATPGAPGPVAACYGQLSITAIENQVCATLGGTFNPTGGPGSTPTCSSLNLTGNTNIGGNLTVNGDVNTSGASNFGGPVNFRADVSVTNARLKLVGATLDYTGGTKICVNGADCRDAGSAVQVGPLVTIDSGNTSSPVTQSVTGYAFCALSGSKFGYREHFNFCRVTQDASQPDRWTLSAQDPPASGSGDHIRCSMVCFK